MAEVIKARIPDKNLEAQITYDFGSDLDGAVKKFGKEAVFSGFVANSRVTIQSGIRTKLEAGQKQDVIQAYYNTYTVGVAGPRSVDPVAAMNARFDTMNEAEQKAYIEDLLKKRKAAAGK